MVMQEESPQATPAKVPEAELTLQPARDYELHIKLSGEMRPLLKDGKSNTRRSTPATST